MLIKSCVMKARFIAYASLWLHFSALQNIISFPRTFLIRKWEALVPKACIKRTLPPFPSSAVEWLDDCWTGKAWEMLATGVIMAWKSVPEWWKLRPSFYRKLTVLGGSFSKVSSSDLFSDDWAFTECLEYLKYSSLDPFLMCRKKYLFWAIHTIPLSIVAIRFRIIIRSRSPCWWSWRDSSVQCCLTTAYRRMMLREFVP